jgi:threonine dehydrogenase-like Zn-dependent dehydrogenase
VARDGGSISRVGVPQYDSVRSTRAYFLRNLTLTGGVAPARSYIDRLLPGVLDGTVEPGRVFDTTVHLDGVPGGYRAMDERASLKVLIRP